MDSEQGSWKEAEMDSAQDSWKEVKMGWMRVELKMIPLAQMMKREVETEMLAESETLN